MAAIAEHNQRFLQLFWDLGSLDVKQQARATKLLLRSLANAQKRHVTRDDQQRNEPGESNPFVPREAQKSPLCVELEYTLDRLVRGLASSRDGARRGFSLALAEVNIH